ncbi:hypothetical protein HY637_02030 [Candidatus Woesearchaeota archaeon]|nr:hypothetical protein [Candidatus Woesearchaeota archaeon]
MRPDPFIRKLDSRYEVVRLLDKIMEAEGRLTPIKLYFLSGCYVRTRYDPNHGHLSFSVGDHSLGDEIERREGLQDHVSGTINPLDAEGYVRFHPRDQSVFDQLRRQSRGHLESTIDFRGHLVVHTSEGHEIKVPLHSIGGLTLAAGTQPQNQLQ